MVMSDPVSPNEAAGQADKSTRVTRALGTTSGALGSFPMILIAIAVVIAWVLEGIEYAVSHHGAWHHFMDPSYQLQINSSTTVVTFLMCFVIQNTQNRDGRAIQTKLDAIMEHLGVDPCLIALEDAPERAIKQEQARVHRGEIK